MRNVAIFASGSGSNAENIIHYFAQSEAIRIAAVLTNNPKAGVIERAERLKVPCHVFSRAEFTEGTPIIACMKELSIDFIILGGFLNKISRPILDSFPNSIINIHPALLPKFGGKGMYGAHVHNAVVEAREEESGITIHYVNENYDEGAIIFQAKCQVLASDTPDDVAAKVHELEYMHFPKIIEQVLTK